MLPRCMSYMSCINMGPQGLNGLQFASVVWCRNVLVSSYVRNPLGQQSRITTSSTLFVVGRSSMIFLCFVMFCGPITLSLLRMIQLIMCDIMTSSSFVGQTSILDCQSLIFFVVKMPLVTSAFHSSAPIPPRSFVVDLHTDTKVTHHLRICRSWCNKARLGPVTGPNLAIEKHWETLNRSLPVSAMT